MKKLKSDIMLMKDTVKKWECEFCNKKFVTDNDIRHNFIEPLCPRCKRNNDVIPVDEI